MLTYCQLERNILRDVPTSHITPDCKRVDRPDALIIDGRFDLLAYYYVISTDYVRDRDLIDVSVTCNSTPH